MTVAGAPMGTAVFGVLVLGFPMLMSSWGYAMAHRSSYGSTGSAKKIATVMVVLLAGLVALAMTDAPTRALTGTDFHAPAANVQTVVQDTVGDVVTGVTTTSIDTAATTEQALTQVESITGP